VEGAGLELSATEVSVGDEITITATAFTPFAPVKVTIGDDDTNLTAGTTVGATGDFTATLTVPLREPGITLLGVEVPAGSLYDNYIITIAAPPAPEEDRTIESVFADLIEDGVLLNVLKFDNATKTYSIYNPVAPELSDNFEIEQFDSLWLEVSEDVEWQDQDLYEGWNQATARR
jgi:hypothetical protein